MEGVKDLWCFSKKLKTWHTIMPWIKIYDDIWVECNPWNWMIMFKSFHCGKIHKKYGIKVWTNFSHRWWFIFQQLEGVPMHDYKYFKLWTMQRFNEGLFRHPNMFYAFEASHYWWQMPMVLWALVKECFMHEGPLLQVWESLVRMRETHNLKEQY